MVKVPMTAKGAQKLREELQQLKTVVRQRVISAIAEARAHGDLKENAEYHAAREQQGFVEGRIADLETKLARAQVIDVTALNGDGRIVFGTTVELINEDTGEQVRYQIVGDDEADIKAGLISVNSPIARALIGKRESDAATVKAPAGEVEYTVVAVKYV
jgi:transcription elongation factor GreA